MTHDLNCPPLADPALWDRIDRERWDRVERLFPGLLKGNLNREPWEVVLSREEEERILGGGM